MSRYDLDEEQRRKSAQKKAQAAIDDQIRSDVQTALQHQGVRRIIGLFWRHMGLDLSPFNTNAMAQSAAIGRQDGARWFLDLIRQHSPEMEPIIRIELAKLDKAYNAQADADPADDDE